MLVLNRGPVFLLLSENKPQSWEAEKIHFAPNCKWSESVLVRNWIFSAACIRGQGEKTNSTRKRTTSLVLLSLACKHIDPFHEHFGGSWKWKLNSGKMWTRPFRTQLLSIWLEQCKRLQGRVFYTWKCHNVAFTNLRTHCCLVGFNPLSDINPNYDNKFRLIRNRK